MGNNWMELGLTEDEEKFVRIGAALYKTVYLDTIDNIFVIARSIKILHDHYHGSGVKGGFTDALVQYGFTARDGGPMNKAIVSHLEQLLAHEAEVRAWWEKVPERVKRDWLSAKAIWRHWTNSKKPAEAPGKPSPHAAMKATNAVPDHDALAKKLSQANARIAELEKVDAGENARLHARIRELEDRLALAEIASGRVPKTVEEMVARRRVAEEIRKAERAAAKAARQAQAPAPEPEETIASLSEKLKQAQQQLKGYQTRVRNLNAHNRAVASGKGVRMSKPLFRQIQKHLHPDKAMNDPKEFKRLNELSQEFNAIKILSPDD